MNLALLDPFELHHEQPEVIEDKIAVEDASVVVCAFNRRGNMLACGCKDGRVAVCDFDTHGVARVLRAHTGCVTSVSWTRSSRRLLSSSTDATIIQWDVLAGAPIVTIPMGAEVLQTQMHPRIRSTCLVCVAAADASPCQVRLLPITQPADHTACPQTTIPCADPPTSRASKTPIGR